jgi:hypothetical protein
VLAVGVGQRRRQGHWVAGQTCVVVKVQWKLDEAQLTAKRRAQIPRSIAVTVEGRRFRVPVDVQETRGQLAGRLQGCVGQTLRIQGAWRGAVGAIVSDAGTAKALIAGHVGKKAGVRVAAGTVSGTTEKPMMTSHLDHCLVMPDVPPSPEAATLADGSTLSGVTTIDELNVGDTVYFHRAATGRRTPVVLRHLDISAPFEYPDGVHQMQHLIATDGSTVEGDSGTLLFDSSFGAVGTLVGLFGNESYFIPCERAFALLGLGLIT